MENLIEISNLPAALINVQKARADAMGKPSDTAVILHLYYPDLWDEINGYLANLGNNFDLYVSVCGMINNSTMERIKQHYPDAFICVLENRGRDIGPFIEMYKIIAVHCRYRYICKIHSKKSVHIPGGDTWRQDLYVKLLGSPRRIMEIKALFDCFPDIGLIGPEGKLLLCRDCLGENATKIIELSQKMGANETGRFDYYFPTGSMFWFKPDAFTPLLCLNIKRDSFETEQGQIDGTLAHAVERIFPIAATVAGYETVDTHILKAVSECIGADWCDNHFCPERFQDTLFLQKSLTKCVKELAKHDREISKFRNSISWRITEPLRRTNRLFSQLTGKK